jgi:nucleoside-diphosphate kinase
MIEHTFVAIKPDGVKRHLVGEIMKRFENAGLKIVGMKMVLVDSEFSKEHYSDHIEKSFYKGLEEYIVSGPVVAMVLEGVSAIKVVRKIVGPTEPGTAAPGTIRGDYAHHTFSYADKNNKSVMNLIHASGNKEDADKETALWFTKQELFNYKINHEEHVL